MLLVSELAAKRLEQRQAVPDAVRRETETQTENFLEFLKGGWHVLEPDMPYIDNWHMAVMAEHLEAVSLRQITKLVINVPPGMSKSLMVSVFWPVWTWINNPGERFLTGSYAQPLATRDSVKSRRLIQSAWFQERWGYKFNLTSDQNQKQRYDNDKMGFRLAVSVGGGTGERGSVRILDDPHNMLTVQSDTQRESDLEWIKTVWPTRKAGAEPVEVVVMQRLHERDASGYYLDEIGGYEHLMLPMAYEPERSCVTMLGPVDPRTEEGDLLFPGLYDADTVADLEVRLGTYGASGQLQQRPSPVSGGIFKRHHWRFWAPLGVELPPVVVKDEEGNLVDCPARQIDIADLTQQLQSWDMTFKSTKDTAFVVGQVWGTYRADRFLLDQVRERLDFPATLRELRRLSEKWPLTILKLVEDKANGPAVIQMLRNEIGGLLPFNPRGDKVARGRAVSPLVETGNVYLPHPALFPWVNDFIENFVLFPNGTFKDEVDSLSQALIYLATGNSGGLGEANNQALQEKGRWGGAGSNSGGSRWKR